MSKRKVEETVDENEAVTEEPDAKKLKATLTVASAGPVVDTTASHIDLTKSIAENLILPAHLTQEITEPKRHRSFEWETHFRNLADFLLNEVVLMVRNDKGDLSRFRLSEIEFYATTKHREHMHEDPFSHCHPLQATPGVWYFHQSLSKTNSDNYKGGSYKGCDFTFGFKNEKNAKYTSYGGILIRSVEELNANFARVAFVDGPSKTADAILEKAGVSSIHDLVSKKFPKASETGGVHLPVEKPQDIDTYPLYLTRHTFTNRQVVYASSRVGMSLKTSTLKDSRARFVVKPYRYFIHASSIKKGKNQMVVSLWHEKVAAVLGDADYSTLTKNQKDSIYAEIVTATGCTKKNAEKYVKQYDEGRENGVDVDKDGKLVMNDEMEKMFGKNLNTDELCKMHGLLYKFL